MDRYAITSYPQAINRIKTNGYIWDVGQIHPRVIHQLILGIQLGLIVREKDGWPLRTGGGIPTVLYRLRDGMKETQELLSINN